jgi:hypothetical protein
LGIAMQENEKLEQFCAILHYVSDIVTFLAEVAVNKITIGVFFGAGCAHGEVLGVDMVTLFTCNNATQITLRTAIR